MTLDDLTKLFQAARGRGNLTRTEGDLKGIRAVVLALRDESGRRGYLNWDNFNAILGDAVEKEPSHD